MNTSTCQYCKFYEAQDRYPLGKCLKMNPDREPAGSELRSSHQSIKIIPQPHTEMTVNNILDNFSFKVGKNFGCIHWASIYQS